MEHYYQKIKGWFNWPEMYARAAQMAPKGAVFVEIGCHVGRSTSCLGVEAVNSGKEITIYAIDLWCLENKIACDVETFNKTIDPINQAAPKRVKIIPLRGDSGELHSQFEDYSVDFVWIDGNHRYPYVIKDIRSWWPKLKYGGWMGGDDLIHWGVRAAVEKFFGPECNKVSGHSTGNWARFQSPSVYLKNDICGIKPADGGWVWWARSKSVEWTPLGLNGCETE